MTVAVAIVFAVLGAALSALGAHLQHRGVRSASGVAGLSLRGIGALAHNRSWLAGVGVLTACAVMQILALALAPVTVVAPIVVLALPVIAVLNARASGTRLGPAATAAVVASTAGVALFVALATSTAAPVRFGDEAVLRAGQVVAGVVLLFGGIGAASRGIPRCVALAAGAGAAYGLVSVLVRDVTYTFQTSGVDTVSALSVTGVVVAFAVGSWFVQLAYASGPPDVVVGCQTVLNPLVATAIAIVLLDETTGAGGLVGVGLVAGAVVAIAGVLVLARRHRDAPAATSACCPGRRGSPRRPSGGS